MHRSFEVGLLLQESSQERIDIFSQQVVRRALSRIESHLVVLNSLFETPHGHCELIDLLRLLRLYLLRFERTSRQLRDEDAAEDVKPLQEKNNTERVTQ